MSLAGDIKLRAQGDKTVILALDDCRQVLDSLHDLILTAYPLDFGGLRRTNRQ